MKFRPPICMCGIFEWNHHHNADLACALSKLHYMHMYSTCLKCVGHAVFIFYFDWQFHNHFTTDVEIYTRVSNWTEKLGVVKGSEKFVVPLNVAHNDQLLVKPLDKR